MSREYLTEVDWCKLICVMPSGQWVVTGVQRPACPGSDLKMEGEDPVPSILVSSCSPLLGC